MFLRRIVRAAGVDRRLHPRPRSRVELKALNQAVEEPEEGYSVLYESDFQGDHYAATSRSRRGLDCPLLVFQARSGGSLISSVRRSH